MDRSDGGVITPLGWRVWLAPRGTLRSSRTHPPADLAALRALGVVQYYEGGARDLLIGDWWWWDGARWRVALSAGRGGVWAPRPDAAIVLQGVEVGERAWEILHAAMVEARVCP